MERKPALLVEDRSAIRGLVQTVAREDEEGAAVVFLRRVTPEAVHTWLEHEEPRPLLFFGAATETLRNTASGAARATTLTKRERLALQLTGHGFCAAELAQMVGEPLERITRILKRATRALGAADVGGALQEARRRGLLD